LAINERLGTDFRLTRLACTDDLDETMDRDFNLLAEVQVPNIGWHWFEAAQNAAELPQLPFTEQQSPKELPTHIAFVLDAAPHFQSVDVGVQIPNLG